MSDVTRFIKIQLVLFTDSHGGRVAGPGLVLPAAAAAGRVGPVHAVRRSAGIRRVVLDRERDVPGHQIGKVTDVEPTERGAEATMSIDNRYKIPVERGGQCAFGVGDRRAVPGSGVPGRRATVSQRAAQTITKGTVPDEVGPALDAANRGLEVLPKEKIDSLLTEASQAVGGLGPALQRLVDSTTEDRQRLPRQPDPINDIIAHSAPILDSPGEVRGRDRAVGGQPELDRRAGRPAGRGAAQRVAAGRADRRSAQRGVLRMCRSRCRRRWPTSRSSSTCSSATTRASSRHW